VRRIAIALLLAVGIAAVVVLEAGRDGGGGSYEVRAIFDNAAYVVAGEDVKVAGAVVGTVKSLDVTHDKRAAVVLQIDDPGFTPFTQGSTCTIRPQSLIGEKYVECSPGPDLAPALAKIESGAGSGQHSLTDTSSPVDLDLVADTLRLPFRQRLTLIINEFGTGLAGRGADLQAAIHRANPALRQTDRVLHILAGQNRTLAQLATDSDAVLTPLAQRRGRIAHFINSANETAQATAARRADLERSIELLPTWLNELRPTLAELDTLADASRPVLADLHTAAPSLARFVGALGPFSSAGIPAFTALGEAARVGRPALERSRPLIRDLGSFALDLGPASQDLDQLTASLDQTGGIEEAMNYLLNTMTAVNGFDSVSHYLRAGLVTNLCSFYATTPASGCSANFTQTTPSQGTAGKRDAAKVRLRAARRLPDPKPTDAKPQGARPPSPDERVLDYLLGSDG
jgi:ABC-type transporter Mla subunit MlaD